MSARAGLWRTVRCRGAGCETVFFLCGSCYRGQAYCGDRCRAPAQRRQRWTRVVGLLVERGHWDPLRSTVLLAYCASYADWHRLTEQVRGREVVLQGGTRTVDAQGHVTTEGGKAAANPLLPVIDRAHRSLQVAPVSADRRDDDRLTRPPVHSHPAKTSRPGQLVFVAWHQRMHHDYQHHQCDADPPLEA